MKDDMKLRESKAKECMIDASKIAEELHNEQELTGVHENDCKLLESKIKDLQVFILKDYPYIKLYDQNFKAKIEEAETSAARTGKKMMMKLEERVRELTGQIDDEGRRTADAQKNFRKAERGVKEYIYRGNEDKKNSERIKVCYMIDNVTFLKKFYAHQDLIDKLQQQVRTFKKQLEEAEDIASNNLAKYKIIQKVTMNVLNFN